MFSLERVIRASSGALVEHHLHETGQPQNAGSQICGSPTPLQPPAIFWSGSPRCPRDFQLAAERLFTGASIQSIFFAGLRGQQHLSSKQDDYLVYN
jgi:hypothetical protein